MSRKIRRKEREKCQFVTIGSPRFMRMEKTTRTMFSDREKYLTTKEVWLLLMLLLASIVVTIL